MYNKYIYIYIYSIVTCLEYSIIMTTENIYICTGRKTRHNNHKEGFPIVGGMGECPPSYVFFPKTSQSKPMPLPWGALHT